MKTIFEFHKDRFSPSTSQSFSEEVNTKNELLDVRNLKTILPQIHRLRKDGLSHYNITDQILFFGKKSFKRKDTKKH